MVNNQLVSVIIPTYYRYADLPNLLKCLSVQSFKPFEILIVDQTPLEDRPKGFYDQYNDILPIRVINLENPSSTESRNTGAKMARGEILCFFDDKIIADEQLIANHLRVMEEENVDVVAGAVFHPSHHRELPENFNWLSQIRNLDPVKIFIISANSQWEGMTIGCNSANFCIKKEVFWRIGGFDEVIDFAFEDYEFSYRLFRSGAKVYFSPKPVAKNKRVHYGGGHHRKQGFFNKVFRPYPDPNYLYIHMKHFPGWTTYQLILKVIFEVYWPSVYWLKHPWNLLLTPIRIIRAYRKSRTLLHRHNEKVIHKRNYIQ